MPASPATPLSLPRPWPRRVRGPRRAPRRLELAAAIAAVGVVAALLVAPRGDPEPAPPFGREGASAPWSDADRLAFVGDCDAAGRRPWLCRCLANAYQRRWPSYAAAAPVLASGDAGEAGERCREYAEAHEAWLARRR